MMHNPIGTLNLSYFNPSIPKQVNNKGRVMLEGYVKSFSQDKGFGFISTGAESYFFHISDLPKSTPPSQVRPGTKFRFDDVPAPKGMQAKKLELVPVTYTKKQSSGFIMRRDRKLKHGQAIVIKPAASIFDRDPEVCRQSLVQLAKRCGCNALLDMKTHRNTWSKGNYHYSMHEAHAVLAIVANDVECSPEKKEVSDLAFAAELRAAETKATEEIAKIERCRFWQTFPWNWIVIAIIAVVFLSIIS